MMRRRLQSMGGAAVSVLLLVGAGCSRHYPANYREYAYVTNTGSNTVSVIDVLSLRKVKDINVGGEPTGVAANPSRNEVYAVNAATATVSVIDTRRNEVVETIAVGKRPYFIDVSSSATLAAVANSGDDSVSIIDLEHRKVTSTVHVGKAPGVVRFAPSPNPENSQNRAVTRLQGLLFVSERISGTVTVVDMHGNVIGTVKACAAPTDLVAPSRTRVFVACSGEAKLAVIGTDPAERNYKLLALLPVGNTPTSLALKPDTGELFAMNFGSGTVSEVITGDAVVNATYDIGSKPSRGLVSADNSLLYVSNFGSNNVEVFSIDNGHTFASVNVGAAPDAMALSNNQSYLFVADSGSNDVAVVRTKVARGDKPALLTMISVGTKPSGIAITAYLQ